MALAACSEQRSEPATTPEVRSKQQAIWTNGDFEENATIGTAPTGWVTSTHLNTGLTQTTPQTYTGLNLGVGGQLQTFVVGGAVETQVDPDLGVGASLRFPKYGTRAVRVNYRDNATSANKGASQNTNALQQTMTVTLGDVDPLDDKVHVRFAVAPVLQNPGHTYEQQPYYFVELTNLTTSATLYQDFNTSGQPGVPWKSTTSVVDSTVVLYTDWQLVDVAPGNSVIRVGDQLRLRVLAAGCQPSGHWGRVYLDAVGSGIPGLYAWATAVQSVNAGEHLTYTVNYKNGSTATAQDVTLDMAIPANTTFVSVSTPATCTTATALAVTTLSCSLGTLAQGAVGSYSVTVQVGAVASGTVITNGTYSIYGSDVSALIGPKAQTTVSTGVSYADVSVSKSDGIAAVTWGQSLSYMVRVSNAGPTTPTSITVVDTMPAQLTNVSWTCVASAGASCAASGSGNINDSASVPIGGSATYTVQATVVAGSGSGSLSNTATATVGVGQTDPDLSNNTAVDVDSIGTLRTLSLTKVGTSNGSVVSTPATLVCGTSCSGTGATFSDGAQVILTASPVAGSSFLGWSGGCSGSANSCTVTMGGDQSVTATFADTSLVRAGGSGQAAAINSAFAAPLRVRVSDSAGNPIPAVAVSFATSGSGANATLSSSSALTDAAGIASVTATSNATLGSYVITATSAAAGGTATFTLYNHGAAATLGIVSGSGQSTAVMTTFAGPLVVLARDALGSPVANATVNYTVGNALRATISAASAVTGANGQASITVTAKAQSGTHNVTARTGSLTALTFALTNSAGPPASIVVTGGSPQSAVVGVQFGTALQFTVRDAQSNAVPAVVVTYDAPLAGASATLSAPSASTNSTGQVNVVATANSAAGAYSVSATVAGVSTAASAALTNTAGSIVSAYTGTPQSSRVNNAFAAPLTARVVDASGNPVPSVVVSFAAPASGARAVLSAASATTDSSGLATITVSANGTIGAYGVTASSAGIAARGTFSLTNMAWPPASVVASGAQNALVGTAFATPLVATVRDGSANLVAGALVTFSLPSSGASATLSSSTALTDAAGQASVTATANTTSGVYAVDIAAQGVATHTSIGLTNRPAPPASVSALSGGAQSATVLTSFASNLTVLVSDTYGNPVPGATVVYGAPISTASATLTNPAPTDATGRTSVTASANALAGSYDVTATLGATSARFALTNTAGAATTLLLTAGSVQSASVTGAFSTPLSAQVRDAQGNGVAGVLVTFVAPASGARAALSSSTATSDASGHVSITASAGTVAGSYAITASATGFASGVSYALTNSAGAAAALSVVSGGAQSKQVLAAFAPMVVRVDDAQGNPVAGATVAFTAPGSGPSAVLGAASASSDSAGLASVTASANTVAGSYLVTASLGASSATFALTNTAAGAAMLTATAGGAQRAVVTTAFGAALTARVQDAHGNGVSGVVVTFVEPSSGASANLSSSSGTTDALGDVSITAIANSVAGSYAISASAPGAASAISFTLSNDPGAPSSLHTSGSGQSATVLMSFSTPLGVTVVDAYDNPIAGVTVTLTAPATGPSAVLSSGSVVSDAAGQLAVSATASAQAGSYVVTATLGMGVSATIGLTNTAGAVGSIVASAGTPQSAVVDTIFGAPLEATVRDAQGNPIAGVLVTFTAPATADTAVLGSPTSTTDAMGRATVSARSSQSAGSYTVTAAAPGAASPADFALTNRAGAASSIVASGGAAQSARVGTAFVDPLVATVRDSFGNPVPSIAVQFSVPSSGASAVLIPASGTSDAAGQVSVGATANGVAGAYGVSAAFAGAATPAAFALGNLAGEPATLTASGGGGQTTTVGTPFEDRLTVSVVDAFNNPVPNTLVTFTAPASGASATLDSTALTDGAGQASIPATANTIAGLYDVSASAVGAATAVLFPLTNAPAAAAALEVSGGSGQSATVQSAFATPLSVVARDRFGNAVAGATVTFSAPSSGASATLSSTTAVSDGTGHAASAATANTRTGTYSATASVDGGTGTSFVLTNTAGAVGTLVVTGGDAQSATVESAYASPLSVTVLDALGNPVPGLLVSFAVPGSGASATLDALSAISDAAGEAHVNAFANQNAGGFLVTASAPGAASSVSLMLTNRAGAASALSIVSGSDQSAQVMAGFAPLVVRVDDARGNPVPGATVVFFAPGSGASALLASASALTDGAGLASMLGSANTTSGSYLVTATLGASSASFGLTNTAAAVATLTATGGDAQQAQVTQGFAAPLTAQVRDVHGNPVAGIAVSFVAPSFGASAGLSSSSVTSDASGNVSITASAGSIVGSYSVLASAPGAAMTASYTLANTPGAPAALRVVSGSDQGEQVLSAFAPLVVRVDDAQGNAVPGATVLFSVAPLSGASVVLAATSASSDSAGLASMAASANATAGSYLVTATLGASSVQFALTNVAGAVATLTLTGGDAQHAVVTTGFAGALTALAQDAHGNAVSDVIVSFEAPASGPSARLSGSTAISDALGQVGVGAVAGTLAGTYTVSAMAPGPASALSFTLTNDAGVPSALRASGSGQTATVLMPFATPISATVVDAYDNPVPGAVVAFSVPGSGPSALLSTASTLTDASGQATVTATANERAGSYNVVAALASGAARTTISLDNTAGAPAVLQIVSGGVQSAQVLSAFEPLVVRVDDAQGNPAADAVVTWSAPASGASAVLGAVSAATDAAGLASLSASANSQAGSYLLTATLGASSAAFALSNTAGAAAKLVVSAGDAQRALVTTAFGSALTAQVQDANGNPVADVAVSFVAPGTGASAILSSASATSDALGNVSVTVIAGSVAGSYAITATAPGASAISFALRNDPGAPSSLYADGSGQSATVLMPFANPLGARVVDAHENPVPGVAVTFRAPETGASATLSSGSVVSDADGRVVVDATASALAGSYSVSAALGTGVNASIALTNTAGAVGSIAASGGTPQSAVVDRVFAASLEATVRDVQGNPVAGVLVTFATPSTAETALLGSLSATTDVLGRATVNARASQGAGSYAISATAPGAASPASFALTNRAGAASSIEASSGAAQSARVGTAFLDQLVATVRDAFANPVPDVAVAFRAPTSGPSAVLGVETATSDARGQVSVVATANGRAGAYDVTAALVGSATPARFALDNLAGTPSTLSASAGGGQATMVVTPFTDALTVSVVDAFDNPVSNTLVTFSVPASGASATLNSTALTDAAGHASVGATANRIAGLYVVTASAVGAASSVQFPLTNTPAAAAALEVSGGGGQSATVETPFATPLSVLARDSYGNAVPGVMVTFAVPPSGPSATLGSATLRSDGLGRAQTTASANTRAGTFSVTASIDAGASANFVLTNTAGAVGTLVVSGGDAQSATVGSAFALPLKVTVLDALSNPVPGVLVSFTVPGSGASATLDSPTATSDEDGEVRVSATANHIAGSILVTASAPGAASAASLMLTSTAGALARLALRGGSGQSAQVQTRFVEPLQLVARDEWDNPVPSVTVSFVVPGSGASASLSASTLATDAQGRASVNATANVSAGSYAVRAAAVGAAADVDFMLTNTAGAVGAIEVVAGSDQRVAIETMFAGELEVLVMDALGNPVAGAEVSFDVPASGASASLSASSAQTDLAGHTRVAAIANGQAGSYVVTASAGGAASPARFALTNLAGTASTLTVLAGDGQRAAVRTPFAAPLRVAVRDRRGNGVEGVVVTFVAPTAGASANLSSQAATSDAAGEMSVVALANQLAGSYSVLATAAGIARQAQFALENTAGAAGALFLAGGDGQATPVNTAFAAPLSLVVRDLDGNPAGDVEVRFDVPMVGASAVLSATSLRSDVAGRVSVAATANTAVGRFQVRVGAEGVATPLIFTLDNLSGAAGALSVRAGDLQSTKVLFPFAEPLRVLVLDALGNPVVGALLHFSVPDSGASAALSSRSTRTDADGVAITTASANDIAGSYAVLVSLDDSALQTNFTLTNVADPCRPDMNALACPLGDFDQDAVANADDPEPSAPCVPNVLALACPSADSDGDDIPNLVDLAPADPCAPNQNAQRCATGDLDGDGETNAMDPNAGDACIPDAARAQCARGDPDGDGIPNAIECSLPSACSDSDRDGAADYLDPDSDGDGSADSLECTDAAACDDADGDGLPDYVESDTVDSDGDGEVDRDDLDSDGDGESDASEGRVRPWPDLDRDGIPSHLDGDEGGPGAGDSDRDGSPDDVECASGLPCVDTDGDHVPDYADRDSDDDGAPDLSDPTRTDGCTPDLDALACPIGDHDADGVANGRDLAPNDACLPDPEQQGCITGDELPPDSDGDGIPDREECSRNDPRDALFPEARPRVNGCVDTDGDDKPDWQDDDSDGDGLPDLQECPSGASCPDSDRDGVPDWLEPAAVEVAGGACALARGSVPDLSWLGLLALLALARRRRGGDATDALDNKECDAAYAGQQRGGR